MCDMFETYSFLVLKQWTHKEIKKNTLTYTKSSPRHRRRSLFLSQERIFINNPLRVCCVVVVCWWMVRGAAWTTKYNNKKTKHNNNKKKKKTTTTTTNYLLLCLRRRHFFWSSMPCSLIYFDNYIYLDSFLCFVHSWYITVFVFIYWLFIFSEWEKERHVRRRQLGIRSPHGAGGCALPKHKPGATLLVSII